MKDLKRDAFLMLFVLTACCSAQAHMFGPTGIHGNLSGKTIVVANVDPLGPAGNGLVKAGDVIIGAGGGDSERAPLALFKENVRYEFADAIDAAETEKAGGKLVLLLKGERRVVLQLKVLGSYSDTAPYKCPKSDAIITQAAEYLVKSGQATEVSKVRAGRPAPLAPSPQKADGFLCLCRGKAEVTSGVSRPRVKQSGRDAVAGFGISWRTCCPTPPRSPGA